MTQPMPQHVPAEEMVPLRNVVAILMKEYGRWRDLPLPDREEEPRDLDVEMIAIGGCGAVANVLAEVLLSQTQKQETP